MGERSDQLSTIWMAAAAVSGVPVTDVDISWLGMA
jgi:hypothetical protein